MLFDHFLKALRSGRIINDKTGRPASTKPPVALGSVYDFGHLFDPKSVEFIGWARLKDDRDSGPVELPSSPCALTFSFDWGEKVILAEKRDRQRVAASFTHEPGDQHWFWDQTADGELMASMVHVACLLLRDWMQDVEVVERETMPLTWSAGMTIKDFAEQKPVGVKVIRLSEARRSYLSRQAHQGGTHASPVPHDRRAHQRRYKRTGREVWIEAQKVRGGAEAAGEAARFRVVK